MKPTDPQVLFFGHLKTQLPPHLSMVDEIAALLNISIDSAYRRIRGDKPISLEEAYILCQQYKLSLDHLFNLQSDTYIFRGTLPATGSAGINFTNWLEMVLAQLQYMNSFKERHMYYLMKDIPPYVHFMFPELAAFKCYFWMKSILHDEQLKGVKFSLRDKRYDQYKSWSAKVINEYLMLPGTEIWNVESLNSTLNQIDFYVQAGAFAQQEDIFVLYDRVEAMINHLEKQAECGYKSEVGQKPLAGAAEYRLFVNELILGDNTILVELDGKRVTYLNHSVLNVLTTRDERFNEAMFANLESLIKKSALISVVGEKERTKFFNRLRDHIRLRVSAAS